MNKLPFFEASARLAVLVACLLMGIMIARADSDQVERLSSAREGTVSIGLEEAHKRISISSELSALSNALFGERIAISNGSTGFFHVDLDIPGNSGLPVHVGRSFKVGPSRTGKDAAFLFGDWDLDIPSLSGVFHAHGVNAGWTAGMLGQPFRRCSVNSLTSARPLHVTQEQNGAIATFQASEYWHGIHLTLPGGSETPLMVIAPENSERPNSHTAYHWTTAGNWLFSCESTVANGYPGESFVGLSPAGEKYWFNWMVSYRDFGLSKSVPRGNTIEHFSLARQEVRLMPTKVEDRFGNWVVYEYDPHRPNRLVRISSSDGRSINLAYNVAGRISQVFSGTSVWEYEYDQAGALAVVRRPDGSSWSFTLKHLRAVDLFSNHQICYDPGALPLNAQSTGSIRHPSGAIGEFSFQRLRRPRSYVPRVCYDQPGAHPWYDLWGITNKKISGPLIQEMAWNYSYSGVGSYADQCATNSCLDASETLVAGPGGVWQRHVFSTRYGPTEGLPRRLSTGDASGVVRTVEYEYQESPMSQLYPSRVGFKPAFGADLTGEIIVPARRRVTNEGGVTFSWEALAFNRWGLPVEVTRSSSLGYSKGELFAYRDLLGMWVLNQPFNRRDRELALVEEVKFYVQSQINRIVKFGIPDYSRWYNLDGTLASAGLPNGANVQLQDYYRGIPRRIVHSADNSQLSATVDSHGRIRSVTDALSNTTNYDYDALGRLTQTRFPAGDSTTWSNQDNSYQVRTVAEYGIPAGLWKRTQTRGRYEHVIWYDAVWRPILTRERDVNLASSERFVRKAYDARGNLSFESYPGVLATTSSSYTNLNTGISRQYDALNRPTVETRSSELGNLVSRRDYLSGFQVRDTNARGQSTTTSFMAYDEPSYDWPMQINEPEQKSTVFQRDRWGKPTAITRNGRYLRPNGLWEQNSTTRRFVYDANQRLCKRIDPEHGATVMDYDSANRLAWTADGLNLPGTGQCDRESVAASQRVVRSYNTKDELIGIDYPDSTDDLSFSYYANGKPQTANVGPLGNRISRTYVYNKRGLPTQELLQLDGFSFPIGYRYSSEGAVSELGYPDLTWEVLNPDGLGRPRQMGQFASNVTWDRSGPLASFNYGPLGSGLSFSQRLNARGLPSERRDEWFGSARLYDTLSWDGNGNLAAITDNVGSVESYRNTSRWMTYDGLDRLTVANSSPQPPLRTPYGYSWGEARFSYDGVDNVRTFKMGAADFSYAYDSNGRLQSIRQAGVAAPIFNYSHNARGQMTGRQFGNPSQQFTLNWDSAHRVTQTWNAGSTVVETYRYDAHGHRVRTVRGGETLYQIYTQGGDLLLESSTNGSIRKYARLGGRLIGETVNGVRRAIHTDVIGSVRQKTDAFGTMVYEEENVRAPYGSTLVGWQYKNGPAFTGHMEDGATGLTYMKARYYDPVAMRFISPDPVYADLGTGGNFNRYWYANNNPYTYMDADGEFAETVWDVLNVGLGAASFVENVNHGNYGWATVDLFGLAYDSFATVVPILPAGAGVGLKASRIADDAGVVVRGAGADDVRGLSMHGGTFSMHTNSAGGEVWTSAGPISQNDFATYVNSGLFKGDVNIISGVHGLPNGGTVPDSSLFQADVLRFGNISGVKVHNYVEMTPQQLGELMQSPGTTIGGFCDSGICLEPYKF